MMIASFLLRNAFDYYDVVLLPSPPPLTSSRLYESELAVRSSELGHYCVSSVSFSYSDMNESSVLKVV